MSQNLASNAAYGVREHGPGIRVLLGNVAVAFQL